MALETNSPIMAHMLVRRGGSLIWHIRRPDSVNVYCGRRAPLPHLVGGTRLLSQRGGSRICEWCVRTFESEFDCRGAL